MNKEGCVFYFFNESVEQIKKQKIKKIHKIVKLDFFVENELTNQKKIDNRKNYYYLCENSKELTITEIDEDSRKIKGKNRIKDNTIYQSIKELELPNKEDQDILKDEIIQLTSPKAKETGISEHQLRLVTVYKADENKVIQIISNNLDWKARTIADLYKKRWDIELFFKAMKQNLQIKSFVGTSENAVKSQIFIALISFLLLELIRRTNCDKNTAFSGFCEKIRVCLLHYLTINYVCNELKPIVKKAEKPPEYTIFPRDNFQNQTKMNL